MAEYEITERPDRRPIHPGAVLRERVIDALGVSVSQFARDIKISRQQLHSILAETSPVTPNIAVRLGKYIGNGPLLWLRMQSLYDLWEAEQELKSTLDQIPERGTAA